MVAGFPRRCRRHVRVLVGELHQRLGGSDPRWREFGLNLPAAPNVPVAPSGVQVNTNTPGEFLILCAPPAYATHCRFFTQRPDLDVEPVFAGHSNEPMFHLTGLMAGPGPQCRVATLRYGPAGVWIQPALRS